MSCQPIEISGRNYMLRHATAELIRPIRWHDGNYDKTRPSTRTRGGNDLTESPSHSGSSADHAGGQALYDKRLATS